MASATLPKFDIRDHLDRLTPVERQKGRYYCNHCGGKNLTFSAKTGKYSCWNGCNHRDIREAIRPIAEALQEAGIDCAEAKHISNRICSLRPPTKPKPKPAPLPDAIAIAALSDPATDAPQPFKRKHRQYGQVTVWQFHYSETQRVERVQWADETKEKGYDKNYFPHHQAESGDTVALYEQGKQVGDRPAQAGEWVNGVGAATWSAYRIDEAIAAAQASGANTILVLEGEPCVEVARSLGLAATTLQGNRWYGEKAAPLVQRCQAAGIAIVSHPDHDRDGYSKANALGDACATAGVAFVQIDPLAIDPELQEHGDIANIVAKLGGEEYQQRLQAEIERQIELRRQLDGGDSDPPSDGGNGDGDDGDGNGGDDFGRGNPWDAPVSWRGEIGIWVKDKETEELSFRPCCNFDFQVVRELTSEDGGGLELALQRSFDRQEKQIFIESIAYTSPEKFIDAVKKALGAGVVCTLSKANLSALIHTRLRDYHQRGGKTYRLAERRGRQPDGTWVFENCQFKPDGTATTTEESGWVYTEVFPNCEDVIPTPVIAPHNPTLLQRYLTVKQRAFGRNFLASMLMDGWVVAGLFDAEILHKERSFPLINPYGDPGGFKSFAAESSLALVGFPNAETMLSKVSESALFEWLKRLGSLPVILDDPKREAGGIDIEEVVKRAYNRFARVVRGNRQEPQGGLGVTANHLVGEKNSATRSRLIPLFFPVLPEGSYEKAAFAELLEVRKVVSGCFLDLLKLGYNAVAIKQLEEEFRQHLPAAHARTAKSIAIAAHYAAEVVRLAGMEAEIDIKQWVIEVLCPLCNESQAGLSSVADFAEHLDVLQSRALVGEWCITEVESEKHGSCMAIHLPTVWAEFDREFKPAYNRSVLEQVLIEKGALKNQVAKFWADRDQTMAYKRQLIADRDQPKEPAKVARKCLLIPEAIWENLFKGQAQSMPKLTSKPILKPKQPTSLPDAEPLSYPPVTSVTFSYQVQVTDSNPEAASDLALQKTSSYLVTFDQEDQEKKNCDQAAAAINAADQKAEVAQIEVTEVTGAIEGTESVDAFTVEAVTSEKLLAVTESATEVTALLPPDRVAQAVKLFSAVDSIESFKTFYGRYQRNTPAQQQQIADAIVDANLADRFYDFWGQANAQSEPSAIEVAAAPTAPDSKAVMSEAINAAPVQDVHSEQRAVVDVAMKALWDCVVPGDYKHVERQFPADIIEDAIGRLSASWRKRIECFRECLAQWG